MNMKSIFIATVSLVVSVLNSWANDTVMPFSKNEVYSINTICLATGPKAKWIILKDGKFDASPENAAGVLAHFDKQEKKRHGIFVCSETHSIPLNDEEKRRMSPFVLKLHQDPEWRASENALIDELVAECEKRGVPLWVNLSSDGNGMWKLLTKKATSEAAPSESDKPSK